MYAFYEIWAIDEDRSAAKSLWALDQSAAAVKYWRLHGPGGDGESDGDLVQLHVAEVGEDAVYTVMVRVEIRIDYVAEVVG